MREHLLCVACKRLVATARGVRHHMADRRPTLFRHASPQHEH